jgi:O-antigen ligase
VALAALAFFGLMVAGCFYGQGTATEAVNYLGKYLDILFIPLFISLFREEKSRNHAITGFMLAMALTLVLSCIIQTGLFPRNELLQGEVNNAFVFKWQLTQNIFMAFFAYLLAVKARYAETLNKRRVFALMAGLAFYNVFFMVEGRTGYLVLAILLVYFCFTQLRWKGLVVAMAIGLVVYVAGYYGVGPLQQRVKLVASEVDVWKPGQGGATSSGLRLDYYTNTLAIIGDHPIVGVGTGGFDKAYGEKIRGTGMAHSNNPHNQYLLITAQLGVLGLALLLYLFITHWRMAGLLPTALEQNLARGTLLTIASGSLFNSLLLDHAEGLFFAWMTGVLFAGLNTVRRQGEAGN